MWALNYKIVFTVGLLLICGNFVSAQWQQYPINCYDCDGNECNNVLGRVRVCQGNETTSQRCLTVFSKESNTTVSSRGCINDVLEKYSEVCAENESRCVECSSNGCNTASDLGAYVECLACDSTNDRNCVLNPIKITTTKKCHKNCMVALHPRNSSDFTSPYELTRSCLDDKDLDDRIRCTNEADIYCKACEDKNCNTYALPEKRQKCYHCNSKTECDSPTLQECVGYSPDDLCYFSFDDEQNLSSMGCRSEFSQDEALEKIKNKKLILCEGTECNTLDKLPAPTRCRKCNSQSDNRCAIDPEEVKDVVTCRAPYSQCYARVSGDSNGTTFRGCLSDLAGDEFFECLQNDNKECQSCAEVDCNTEVIPTDRLKCQRCNSTNDNNCEANPMSVSVCPIYRSNDACVSLYFNGLTIRGCSSEVSCDAKDFRSCQICSRDGCNTANLKRATEGIYGVFQDLPLKCYTCSGEECQESIGSVKTCANNDFQDCVTVFNSTGHVIRRGCEDAINLEDMKYCADYPEFCFTCKSNECNTISNATDYVNCTYCDSALNANCVRDLEAVTTQRKCPKGCVSALHSADKSVQSLDLVRTCLDDVESDDISNCSEETNCVPCSENNCNNATLPKLRLSCNFCEDQCDSSSSELCTRYNETDQCFILFDDTQSAIRMGCKSDLTPNEVQELIKSLFLCNGDDCNDFDKLPPGNICTSCNSSSDVLCATRPAGVMNTIRCEEYPYTHCYSRVSKDGFTHRGCLQQLETEEFVDCLEDGEACQTCTGVECNNEIFPPNRFKCYRCDSSTDPTCESLPSAIEPCPLYKGNETCVTKAVDGVTRRDCGSEIECGALGRKYCHICQDDSCNSVDLIAGQVGKPGLWQDLPLNCYSCVEENCANSSGALKTCDGDKFQVCSTVFNLNGTVTARGCSDIVDKTHADFCDEHPDNCFECKSSSCNSAFSTDDYVDCIFCDARSNPNCIDKLSLVNRSRKCHKGCMTALFPRTSEPEPIYELTRSCLDDKNLDDQENCDTDPYCQKCVTPNCNSHIIPKIRKTCLHCVGDSCQNPQASTCRSFTAQEECFISFDESGTIVEMGCKSDYNSSEFEHLLASKRLFLCEDDNCNLLENIPSAKSCHICNSRTDRFCATMPEKVISSTLCQHIPITDCYTRIIENGYTERGCLSDLNGDQFLDCYRKTNESQCTVCSEENCNNKLFPADRLACHTCDSDENSSCDSNPMNSAVCVRYLSGQTCVTSLVGNITHRGCSEEVSCDLNDRSTCRSCKASDCNTINLKRLSDANPGVWQVLPLSCYECSGQECVESQSPIHLCEGNIHQHCMTVFNDSGALIRRGCSDSVEQELGKHCDQSPQNCFNCNSNGCNTAKSQKDYVDCISCDSKTNKDCLLDSSAVYTKRKCHKSCMVALYPRNASYVSDLVRGCLDDKDIDDRLHCGLDGSLCRECVTANCNDKDAVEDRLECFSCSGSACEVPSSAKCLGYIPNDTCFILFNNENTIERMGCTSDLDEEEVVALRDRLYTCIGKNCNDIPNIPKSQTCGYCDSKTDMRCASLPTDVPTVSTCSQLPHVDCYTRINKDGTTVRGCVSNLPQIERLSCLSGDDLSCTTCIGNKCNVEVFPENRLRCHKCNSQDDPNCQDAPNAPYVCPVYNSSEVCSSKLVDDVTYRGCGFDFLCDDSDKQFCKMCNSTNCNRANLYAQNIGYPGKWQGLPISCYACSGEECNDDASTPIRKCENNDHQNCVTVFNNAGKVVQRGCSDQVYEGLYDQHCDDHPELCFYCKSSGCNVATQLDDFVDCLFCDTETNQNCTIPADKVVRSRKCRKQCAAALYPRSTDDDPAYELSRTCLDDMDLDERNSCLNGESTYCKACDSDNCNTEVIPKDRPSCLHCTGECYAPYAAVCSAYRPHDRCFIQFDDENSVIRMGCASDLETSSISALRKRLLFCDDDNCNDYSIIPRNQNCLVCDSGNETLCATNPEALSTFTDCTKLPYTSCYTRIEGSRTKRGCLSDVESDILEDCMANDHSSLCTVCDGVNCNTKVYPSDRRSCHRCSSDEDSNCQSNPSEPGICPIYHDNDECVVSLSNDVLIRGCTSEVQCNSKHRDTCRICSNDNCNIVDLLTGYVGQPGQWQDLPLSCYNCDGPECQENTGVLASCWGNNLQNCMTVFNETGHVVKRACSDRVAGSHEEYCDLNPAKCISCKSSGCNVVASLDEYVDCLFCDTSLNPDCVRNPGNITRTRKCHKQCMTALFPKFSEEDTSFDLTRSCLDDKEEKDRDSCEAGSDSSCQACSRSHCNNATIPSDRQQCFTCHGEGCQRVESQICTAYHPNDQCFIIFNNESSIIRMGCRSEFSHSVSVSLVSAKRMLLCDGQNCNSYGSIPNPQDCIVCDSAFDPRCATNPNLITNATRCASLPYTECYTLVDKLGYTVRGCLAGLASSEFYSCHVGSDPNCSKCAGGKCNAEVFPPDRLRCHRCSSTDDPQCSEAPASNAICPKLTNDEVCVVSFNQGITYRGCSSEIKCDISDRKSCRVCTDSACNTHNLAYIANDGEPGLWQDLPIKCLTCEGDECLSQEQWTLEECKDDLSQNCMTVFNDNDKVIRRGCSNVVMETQEDWCDRNREKCYRCNSNKCNVAVSQKDYVECVSCQSGTNSTCVTNPSSLTQTRKCYQSCMTAMFARSVEEDPSYALTRTCLDDKELEDREACKPEHENDLCKSCVGDKCNTNDLPPGRRKCFRCSGDDCQLPKEEHCPNYRSNDQCFILFDENQMIVEMGCRSDLTIAQSTELVKLKRLLLCDDDNCNSIESLPKGQPCAVCNSRTDPICAVNPSILTSTTNCNILPFTQCYSRVLNDGATERGCLSNLHGNDFYDCLIGNSTTCEACASGKCNQQVFPADRLACHVCDSESDPNCESSPAHLNICHRYDTNETCVTAFRNGVTNRDCGTSLKCDPWNKRSCRICSNKGCNTVDLAKKQDDNFGHWQDLPLKCYHCNEDSCLSGLGDLKHCQYNNEQDCSMVFNENGQIMRRGCSDKVEEEFENYCTEHPDYCFNCKSNECNTATAPTNFTDCIYCDSNKDKHCVTDPLSDRLKSRKCQTGCMSALYAANSTSKAVYALMRTCLDDKESQDQTICTTGDDAFCRSCHEANCNFNDVPKNPLTCHSCFNETCEKPVSEKCALYSPDDRCFIQFNSENNIIEMGCLSAFKGQEIKDILKTKQVYICEGKDCNSLDRLVTSQRCAACDSKTDINCAVNPLSVGTVDVCRQLPYTDCYTKITAGGGTKRGCLADLSGDEFADCILSGGDNCTHCVGDGCNKELFPKSRLQCFSCQSDVDSDCQSSPSTMNPCPFIRDSEKCVTSLKGNLTLRGCSTQLSCDLSNRTTCRHCATTGCNSLDLVHRKDDGNHGKWQELPLRCYSCRDDDCFNSLGPAEKCQGADMQDCMTVFNSTGAVISRGCQFDVEDDLKPANYCREHPDMCFVCKSNECNDAWELSKYIDCIYCDSEYDSNCIVPTKSTLLSRKCHKNCMVATFTAKNETSQIIRTCLDDKETEVQHVCASDTSGRICSSCAGDKCNRLIYPKDRLSCHVCTSASCSTFERQHCLAYLSNDTCFTKYSNGTPEFSGCSSSVDSNDLHEWKLYNNLYTCSGSDCNALEKLPSAHSCLVCDSSKNEECATDVATVNTTELCIAPISSCYTNITNGLTHRGCLRSLALDQQATCTPFHNTALCENCPADNCNNQVFPKSRRRCHICSSQSDEKCRAEPSKLSICPNYTSDDKCVIRLENGVTERGCSSDLTCDVADSKKCKICETDGCNFGLLEGGSPKTIVSGILLTVIIGLHASSWI